MNKDQIREKMLVGRRNLPIDEIVILSEKICKSAFGILDNAKSVGIYLAVNNEVEPRWLIDRLIKQGTEVYVPMFSTKTEQYAFSKFNGWGNLEKGPFNILQPIDAELKSVDNLDIIFVPGVAFDKSGIRLGYGKGIYDRLLVKSKAKRIGLAYDFQVVDELPREEHDLVMDIIVTEKRIMSSQGA